MEPAEDPVAAIVNGEIIRRSDVVAAHRRLPEQFQGAPIQMVYPMLLNGLIGGKLAAQQARRSASRKTPSTSRSWAASAISSSSSST